MMTESLWRDGSAARRRSVLDTDIFALSAVPPLVARRRQRGLSVTLAKLLPLALVMIAGPQILLRAIFVATTPNWWRNSAAFVVGAGAAITATVTIASSRVMGHPTSSSSLMKLSGRLWRRARRSGAQTRSATSLWRCTWTRPTDCTECDVAGHIADITKLFSNCSQRT